MTAEMSGQQVACPHCDSHVTVPQLDAPSPPESAQPPNQSDMPPVASNQQTGAPVQQKYPPGMDPPVTRPSGSAKTPSPSSRSDAFPPGYQPPSKEPVASPKQPPSFPKAKETQKGSKDDRSSFYPPGFEPGAKEKEIGKSKKPSSTGTDSSRETTYRYPPGTVPPEIEKTPPEPTKPSAPPDICKREAAASADSSVDELLPPGSTGAKAGEPKTASADDDLLPSASSPSGSGALGNQVALPAAKNQPIAKDDNIIAITAEDGSQVTLREPVKKVGTGADAVELRSLTREEKARRRRLTNIIMFAFCLLVLGISLMVLLVMQSGD